MSGFVRARTEEQIADRREEIISACEEIYLAGGYDAVSFMAISERTSFTRPSIYNYFSTKEEVMMDLLSRYFSKWISDIEKGMEGCDGTREGFCRIIADMSVENERMFLLFTDLKIIEDGSSLEHIIAFKVHFRHFTEYFDRILEGMFGADAEERKDFYNGIVMLLFGCYPHTHLSVKQIDAMKGAGIGFQPQGFGELFYRQLLLLVPRH